MRFTTITAAVLIAVAGAGHAGTDHGSSAMLPALAAEPGAVHVASLALGPLEAGASSALLPVAFEASVLVANDDEDDTPSEMTE